MCEPLHCLERQTEGNVLVKTMIVDRSLHPPSCWHLTVYLGEAALIAGRTLANELAPRRTLIKVQARRRVLQTLGLMMATVLAERVPEHDVRPTTTNIASSGVLAAQPEAGAK